MTTALPSSLIRRALLGAAILGASISAGPTATAQSKEDLARARTLFSEAVALASANNCTAALTKYKEVAQVKLTAKVAFNIAECEERLGKLVSSLGNYRLAVAQGRDDKADPKLLHEAGLRVEALEARVPKLTVTRGKGSDEATILLDGTEIGQAQLGQPMPLDPGPHVIIARVNNKEYLHETVKLAEKEAKTFDVKINGPKVKVEDGGPDIKKDEPPPPPPKSRVPGAVVTGVGGAALVTGIVAIAMRQGAISTLNGLCNDQNQCRDTPEARDAASKGKTMTGLSEIMIPVGVVGAAVGVFLLVTSGPQKPKKEARALEVVGWAPGASVGGASLLGRF